MRNSNIRTIAIVLAAGIGLGGCASYSPYGYGSGVSVGYGNSGYNDPYYGGGYSGYGYGSPYGYGAGYGYGSPYGYGYGSGYAPYYGWNNGYYYPGTGYYVYDRYRRPRVWTDAERQYWADRASRPGTTTTRKLLDNWAGFSQGGQGAQANATQTTRSVRSSGGRTIRVQRNSDEARSQTRSERAAERASRGIERSSGRSRRPADPQSE